MIIEQTLTYYIANQFFEKTCIVRLNKLEQTIQAISKKERRLFAEYIASPFFNKREDAVRLYEWLQHGKRLEPKEAVFGHVYPGAAFDRQRLSLAMSYLQRLTEQFLAYRHWRSKPFAYDIDLVQVFRQRGLVVHFEEALRTAKNSLEHQPLRNGEYYTCQGQLLWEEARFGQKNNSTEIRILSQLSDNADLLWVTQKLHYLCLLRTQQMLYQSEEEIRLSREIEEILARYKLLEIPSVAIWYYCLKMLENPDSPEYFSKFKQPLLEQGQMFDTAEIRDLFLFAINHCIRQVNEGHTSFFHDIMDFYKDGLTKGYLLENGVLSRFTYHNIVAAGLQTLEFEWVEDFIARYKNALERAYRDSSYSFNRARLEFKRKRYGDALELLQHTNYYDPLLSLAARTMSLKIYYELNEFDLLYSHLEALKNYIRRKTVLGYHRANYLNLVRYTQKLISINLSDKAEVESLRQKIQAEPVLTEREWLLEQLSALRH